MKSLVLIWIGETDLLIVSFDAADSERTTIKPTKSQQSREKSERMNRMSRQTPLHIVLNGTHQTQDMLVCIEYE